MLGVVYGWWNVVFGCLGFAVDGFALLFWLKGFSWVFVLLVGLV